MFIGPQGIVVEVSVYSWWVRNPGKEACDIQGALESSVAGKGGLGDCALHLLGLRLSLGRQCQQ